MAQNNSTNLVAAAVTTAVFGEEEIRVWNKIVEVNTLRALAEVIADTSELYAEDVQLISKNGKLYYLPENKEE